MKYYVYSDDTGNGDFAETMEEAMKIAQEYAVSDYDIGEYDIGETDTIDGVTATIQIYKLYQTLEAQTTITFNVVREDTYNGS